MIKRFTWYILIGLIVLAATIGLYIYFFSDQSISKDGGSWGNFGSYVGGLAGAFLSFISIVLLVETLANQVESNRTAQFESTFFELFKMHKEVIRNLKGTVSIRKFDYSYEDKEYSGEEYFEVLSQEFNRNFDSSVTSIINQSKGIDGYIQSTGRSAENERQFIINKYNSLYADKESELGHYFRSLYHVFKYVDQSNISNKNTTST